MSEKILSISRDILHWRRKIFSIVFTSNRRQTAIRSQLKRFFQVERINRICLRSTVTWYNSFKRRENTKWVGITVSELYCVKFISFLWESTRSTVASRSGRSLCHNCARTRRRRKLHELYLTIKINKIIYCTLADKYKQCWKRVLKKCWKRDTKDTLYISVSQTIQYVDSFLIIFGRDIDNDIPNLAIRRWVTSDRNEERGK